MKFFISIQLSEMHGTGRVKSAELSGLIVIKSLYLVDVEYLFR